MTIKPNKVVFLFLTASLFILTSCSKQLAFFGESKIEKPTDSIYIKQRIAEIKGVNPEVFEKSSFNGTNDAPIKYRLRKPTSADSKKKFPLVIVFHGSNAVGTDNVSQLGILAKLFASDNIQTKYPAYILAPQFSTRSSNYVLDKNRNVLASVAQPCLETSIQLIDSLKQTLNIDETRIYAVGFSMGASSVINVLSMKPDLFAAGLSISGIPQFDKINELANIPIWIIHGNIDTENPMDSDKQFFKELSYKNKIRFWEFENTAHNDIFSTPILGEEIPKWLFGNKRK